MDRIEKQRAARPRGASPAQLRDAERGLRQVLALEFPAPWIAQNVHDLLNQANVEYAEWLGEHGPASNPPGWLIQRGRWRALNLAKREGRQSGPPLDSVIHSAEDPEPSPEDAVLDCDRRRRIEKALSNIPEKDRKLIALVYYEGHSIRAAGRLLGLGKSNADKHHARTMKRLQALLGPRDLLAPAPIGLAAQAMALRDRGRLVGGVARRITASVQDLAAFVARAFSSVTGSAEEAARRTVPFADARIAANAGGVSRALAQCGAMATAAICSVLVVSSPPVEQALSHHQSGSAESEGRSPGARSNSAVSSANVEAPIETAARSSAAARTEEARRIERRRRHRARRAAARRQRRRARISRARRLRKAAAKAKATRVKRNESVEAPEEAAPDVTETAPETVVPDETETSPPPPATGPQTREEFNHL